MENITNYSDKLTNLFNKMLIHGLNEQEIKIYNKLCEWFNKEIDNEQQRGVIVTNEH